jgi:DNA-binding NarL/FixJ family response regulator
LIDLNSGAYPFHFFHKYKLLNLGLLMHSDISVMIIEEDFYARHWMSLLLARDWRTRSACEVGDVAEAVHFLSTAPDQIDLILLDADFIKPNYLKQLQPLLKSRPKTKILVVGDIITRNVLRELTTNLFAGYLIKSKIKYSLAWAVVFACEGYWIITPGILEMAIDWKIILPKNKLILNGQRCINNLTEHESEVARLALIFSMERRDMADELHVASDWAYGLVSELYKKLGLEEVLEGKADPKIYFGDHPAMLEHYKLIVDRLNGSKKAKDMETLAFHLVTTPELED